MAQNLSSKKQQYLIALVANSVAFKAARDQMGLLTAQWNADATYSGITQADIDGAALGGSLPPQPVGHLTPTVLANYTQIVQPAIETAVAAHLANFLDVLPN